MVKNLLPVTSLNMFHFKNSLQCDRLNIFYKLINVKFTTLFPLVPFLSPHNSNLRYTLPVWLDILCLDALLVANLFVSFQMHTLLILFYTGIAPLLNVQEYCLLVYQVAPCIMNCFMLEVLCRMEYSESNIVGQAWIGIHMRRQI